jgi:hypothetical protein
MVATKQGDDMKCRKGKAERIRQWHRTNWHAIDAVRFLLRQPRLVVASIPRAPVVPDLVVPPGTKVYTGHRDDAGELQWEFMGTTV